MTSENTNIGDAFPLIKTQTLHSKSFSKRRNWHELIDNFPEFIHAICEWDRPFYKFL